MNAGQPDAENEPASPRARRRLSAQDSRERRRTLVTGALFAALCMLLVNAVVGENGYLATLTARREEGALKARLSRIRMDNQELQQAARRLSTDPAALEETARRELGLMKPGETLLVIHDSAPAPSSASASK
jgi:cell division protein FtsB